MSSPTGINEQSYEFTLVLSVNADDDTFLDEIADTLISAGWDDATFSVNHGEPRAEFTRSAPSLRDAVDSALMQARGIPEVSSVRIET